MTAPATTLPHHGISPGRLFVVVVLAGGIAAGGYFAAVGITQALGYGTDTHLLRVAAMCAFLFVNALIVLWAGVRWPLRVLCSVAGLALAASAWIYLPARSGGLSLAGAIEKRNALQAQASTVPLGDSETLREMSHDWRALNEDFPELSASVRADLERRADETAARLVAQLRQVAPDDLAGAQALQAQVLQLGLDNPWARPTPAQELRAWKARAVQARVDELNGITASDTMGFDRTAASRQALAAAFPDARTALIEAEARWVQKTADYAVVAYTHAEMSPRQIREGCRDTVEELLALKSLDASPGRFLQARRVLFEAAHSAAQNEIQRHLAGGRADIAQTVAVSHGLEWFATVELLGAEEQKSIMTLRESCRYLAVLSEKAGGLPEIAPEPRSRAIAPEPRPK